MAKKKYYRRTARHPITGKRKDFYAHSPRELEDKIRAWEESAQGDAIKTFKSTADEWWSVEAARLQPSTQQGYWASCKKACEEFGTRKITDISTSDITRYLIALGRKGYAKKTVKNHLIVVSRILHYAAAEGYISSNPARDVELPRGLSERRRTAATPMEERRIKNAPKDVWLLPVMAIYTGMRKGELIGLMWDDIDFEHRTISVSRSVWYGDGERVIKSTKTDAGTRTIPIVKALYERLIEAKKTAQGAFVFGDDKPLSEKKYRILYARFQGQVGVSCTLHQLRKSFATYAVEKDLPPDVLKAILGHADISTTLNIYAETRASRVSEAGALLEE